MFMVIDAPISNVCVRNPRKIVLYKIKNKSNFYIPLIEIASGFYINLN